MAGQWWGCGGARVELGVGVLWVVMGVLSRAGVVVVPCVVSGGSGVALQVLVCGGCESCACGRGWAGAVWWWGVAGALAHRVVFLW